MLSFLSTYYKLENWTSSLIITFVFSVCREQREYTFREPMGGLLVVCRDEPSGLRQASWWIHGVFSRVFLPVCSPAFPNHSVTWTTSIIWWSKKTGFLGRILYTQGSKEYMYYVLTFPCGRNRSPDTFGWHWTVLPWGKCDAGKGKVSFYAPQYACSQAMSWILPDIHENILSVGSCQNKYFHKEAQKALFLSFCSFQLLISLASFTFIKLS